MTSFSETTLSSNVSELYIPESVIRTADSRFLQMIDVVGVQLFSTAIERKKLYTQAKAILLSIYARSRVS